MRDERFDHAAQLFCFRQGRENRFVLQHRRSYVAEYGVAMRAVTPETTTRFSMTHCLYPLS
jgi:hypothetical protein